MNIGRPKFYRFVCFKFAFVLRLGGGKYRATYRIDVLIRQIFFLYKWLFYKGLTVYCIEQ